MFLKKFFLLSCFMLLYPSLLKGQVHLTPIASPSLPSDPSEQEEDFQRFLANLYREASGQGIEAQTFSAAFQGIRLDPSILPLTQSQAEFMTPLWHYLAKRVSPNRIVQGRKEFLQRQEDLHKMHRRYGVPPAILLALWGLETNFGSFIGNKDLIRSLATLAFLQYRGDFFKKELLTALSLVQHQHVPLAFLRSTTSSSWAGAMGHTQFMPSTFAQYAVDFNGDGFPNIWQNVSDALASSAHYLQKKGWDPYQTWGFEVILPPNLLPSLQDYDTYSSWKNWQKKGIRRIDGQPFPKSGKSKLFLPAGLKGPVFLLTKNFEVLKTYNSSTAYALSVALLADQIAGLLPLQSRWPEDSQTLSGEEIKEVQQHLQNLSLPITKLDGRAGEELRTSVRLYQAYRGLPIDGYADKTFLLYLRADVHRGGGQE